MKKSFIFFVLALLLCGCVSKEVRNFKVMDLNESSNLSQDWYKSYNQPSLNNIVYLTMKNNADLQKAAIKLDIALLNAGLISADLYPTFASNLRADFQKDISHSGDFAKTYGANLGLSYEIDLFRKIRDSVSAAEYEAKATAYDNYATKLSILNSCVDTYFKILYLQSQIDLIDKSIKNYEKIYNIESSKYRLGKSNQLASDEISNSILNLKNQKFSTQSELENNKKLLKEIANLSPDKSLGIPNTSILNVKFLNVNLNIPYYTLYARPDLKEKIAMINAKFFDSKAAYKNFFPSLSLSSSLSSAGSGSDGFKLNIFGTNLGLSLPIFDFYRLNQRYKISELEFKSAMIDYSSTLNNALNEVNFYYKNYLIDKEKLSNVMKNISTTDKIVGIYYSQYKLGKNTMKNYLDAQNKLINTKLDLIKMYYQVLSDELGIFEAMGGRL